VGDVGGKGKIHQCSLRGIAVKCYEERRGDGEKGSERGRTHAKKRERKRKEREKEKKIRRIIVRRKKKNKKNN